VRRIEIVVVVELMLLTSILAVTPAHASSASPEPQPAAPTTLRNPIRGNAGDPFMFYHDGAYYLLVTLGDRISLWTDESVTGLAAAQEHVVWLPDDPTRDKHLWAPELHLLDGRWYLYYSATEDKIRDQRMYVLESQGEDPLGPYHFKAAVQTKDWFSIDGSLLRMPDGALYMMWSDVPPGREQRILIAPMSNPWTISGPPSVISRPEYGWERKRRPGNEGPAALWHGGRLFVTYSGSNCATSDYALGLLTYNTGPPTDPNSWTKSPEPIFGRSDANWVFGPGHNSFFTSPDGTETWMTYHAVTTSDGRPDGDCGERRTAHIQKVNWNADGTPVFGVPAATWENVTLPSGDPGADAVSDGYYRLTPDNNAGNALSVSDCSNPDGANGADVVSPYSGMPCQQWRVEAVPDGTYKITDRYSGRSLDLAECAGVNGADVVLDTYSGQDCQRWYLDSLGGGSYRATPAGSGRALDVRGCSADPGSDAAAWPYWNGDCQRWRLDPVP
jgi:GH43 family beta-xylosidase